MQYLIPGNGDNRASGRGLNMPDLPAHLVQELNIGTICGKRTATSHCIVLYVY